MAEDKRLPALLQLTSRCLRSRCSCW
jgi:hypothetical protein